MIELLIGFILGIILITFLKSSSMVDYEEQIEALTEENKELKEKLIDTLKKNKLVTRDNERLKTRIIDLIQKLGGNK